MCFSATASFAAAAGLGAVGAASLRHVRSKDQVALALVPTLFAIQQAVEGIVWLTFGRPALHAAATFVFVLFSHVFWPVFLPIAVWLIEPDRRRRRVLVVLITLGAAVSATLLLTILKGPISAEIAGRSLNYVVRIPDVPFGFVAYLLATCFSCLLSTRKYVKLFGAALVLSLLIASWSYRQALYSVWCFFAALLSLIIYVHLRQERSGTKNGA